MRKFSLFIAAVTGAAILTFTAFAQAFSGHGSHHRGSPALAACLGVTPKSAKTNLWPTVHCAATDKPSGLQSRT